MAGDIPPPPFVFEGLDPVPASRSTIEELSDERWETWHAPKYPEQHCAARATRVPVNRLLGVVVARRR
jgi:hypothetical protein